MALLHYKHITIVTCTVGMNLQLSDNSLAIRTMMNFKFSMMIKIRQGPQSKSDNTSVHDHLMMSYYCSVAFLGPSVTPYTYNNPAYRIYEIQNDTTFQMIDHHVYYFNLTAANSNKNNANWQYLYGAKVRVLEIM